MATPKAFYLLDKRTIKRTGNKVAAWLAVEFREKQTVEDGSGKTFWSSMWRVSINCKDETLLTLSTTHYESLERQGKQVFTFTNEDKPEWYSAVMPDTVGESLKDRLCAK